MVYCYVLFAIKVGSRSQEMLWRISWQWYKTTAKIMKGSLDRITIGSEGKSISRMYLFQKEQIAFPSVMEIIEYNQIVTRWLACTLGNITILLTQCHFLLLTCWVLTNSYSHIICSELKPCCSVQAWLPCLLLWPIGSSAFLAMTRMAEQSDSLTNT